MSTPHLRSYPSYKEFLDAIAPRLLPEREWQSHLALGLNMERVEGKGAAILNEGRNDFYATTWIGDEMQLALFHFHNNPINITLCLEHADMNSVDEQLELLAEFVATQPTETVAGYSQIGGPIEVIDTLAQKVAEKLDRELDLISILRTSYVDKEKFRPQPLSGPGDVIRKATLQDDIPRMAHLVQDFFLTPPITGLHAPMTLEEYVAALPRPISNGNWNIYVVPDGTITAMCMSRRETPKGIGISAVVTDLNLRRRGYGGAITSGVVEWAFKSREEGGAGKEHVVIHWVDGGNASRVYKKLGFVDGFLRRDYLLKVKEKS